MSQKTPGRFILHKSDTTKQVYLGLQRAGVDVSDADKVVETFTAVLVDFFNGLRNEGQPREKMLEVVGWMSSNIKNNMK